MPPGDRESINSVVYERFRYGDAISIPVIVQWLPKEIPIPFRASIAFIAIGEYEDRSSAF